MTVARDFEDIERDYGEAAVRNALDAASFPGPDRPPFNDEPGERLNLAAQPFGWRDPTTIPRRKFLYGFELRRRQISAVIAPGAAGKTTFKIGRAICIATGRDMFGHRVWNGPHRVWLWNLEDEMEEVEKTVHAFLKLWNIDPADFDDRLYINGADSVGAGGLKLAVEDNLGKGFRVQRPVSDALIEELTRLRIDYLDVDPFVSSHGVDENSNQAIDAIAKEWLRIAREANTDAGGCAIGLTHHIRKTSSGEVGVQDARGAKALTDASRSCLVLQRMTRDDALKLQIPECDRKKYFSVYDDKNNKAPPALKAEWYEFVGIGLGNGDETGPEDNIGAVQRWTPPDVFGGVTARQLNNVQLLIDKNPEKARKHSKSKHWVGKIVAHVLDRNLDQTGAKQAIEEMVRVWLDSGSLRTVERIAEDRHTYEFVEVGRWADVT